jgi:copper chaperone NosL
MTRLLRWFARGVLLALLLVLVACGRTPAPIEYGSEGCDYCRMEITDPRYGAQLVTSTGKVHAFDSVECLASFAASIPADRTRAILVSDFANPGTMLPVEAARFYRDTRRSGPMGGGILAVSKTADSAWVELNVRGAALAWDELSALAAAGEFHPAESFTASEHRDAR